MNKLGILSAQMDVELDELKEPLSCPHTISDEHIVISHALMPNGEKIRLLKTVLTSACENNCLYCAFRSGRDFHRFSFKPDELANTFMSLYHAGIAQGIFISSGIIKSGLYTQDQLIKVAEILRYKKNFQGYIHLKIMPGADYEQVFRSMQLANRVSINLEAPNTYRLNLIAPCKREFDELITPLQWIETIRQSFDPYLGWEHRWPSSSTQFVVGAAGESDYELLSTTHILYHDLHLKRTYFSKFKPISDTPLFTKPGESPARELRLYQASYLLRDYGFDINEIPFDKCGYISQQSDPKYTWAKIHLVEEPIEINHADKQMLLRIPGIGKKTAQLIIEKRRIHKFSSLNELSKIVYNAPKMAPFILLNGKKPPVQQTFTFFDS